jgi:hypothetical protein
LNYRKSVEELGKLGLEKNEWSNSRERGREAESFFKVLKKRFL